MTKLQLSFAIGNYDRTRALIDGVVTIDGVDPVYMTLAPEEIFFRAFRAAEFDICELSLSSYTIQTARNESPYIAIPAFVSWEFRHTAIYVRTDRVKNPADLKGKKVGVPEYQLTANVWARAFLADDYGINPSDIYWIRGDIESPVRPEKIVVDLPHGVRLDNAPEGATISDLLERGDAAALVLDGEVSEHTREIRWTVLVPRPSSRATFRMPLPERNRLWIRLSPRGPRSWRTSVGFCRSAWVRAREANAEISG